MAGLWAWVLLGCRGPEAPPAALPDALAAAARDAGYRVRFGDYRFGTGEGCCEPGADCQLINPSSPYGTWLLPPGPDPEVPDEDPFADVGLEVEGLSRAFRMRADEAVVWIGRTPPAARYLSHRSYLALRRDGGEELHVVGSLGPSLNHLVLAERLGADEVFERPIAIVTTMDAAVEAEVHALLTRLGVPEAWIFDDRIPPELVRDGLREADDSLLVLTRVALPDDPDALAAYVADPGAAVLRLSPRRSRPAVAPHPPQPLPPRGTGSDESHLAEALEALEDAVRAAYPDRPAIGLDAQAVELPTYDCLQDAFCAGEIADRYWASSPRFSLPAPGDFAVVLGVNHRAAGKATYANFAIDNLSNWMGVVGVDDRQLEGSARHWLPDHPDADQLYAWVIARGCEGHPAACLDLPTTCPEGVGWEDPLRVSVRAYLEPATGAGPIASELLPDRVLKFFSAPAP